MGNVGRILIVDDDIKVIDILRLYFEKEGFEVVSAIRGEAAIKIALNQAFDIMVLDVMMPFINGWEVCQNLRNRGFKIPILFLTAKTTAEDKIHGFNLGGDDYVEKPFNPLEVVMRIKAILKRSRVNSDEISQISYPQLLIKPQSLEVFCADQKIDLTSKEVKVLTILAANPGRVYSREQLIKLGWGDNYEGENRNIDVHIKHLRDKLKLAANPPWKIKTVWGIGYSFVLTAKELGPDV